MQRIKRFGLGLCLAIGTLLLGTACSEKSPLEQMIETRSRYSAEINPGGFYVDSKPMVAEFAEAEIDPEAEPADETAIDTEEPELVEPVEVMQTAYLDILIKHDSYDKLPGVTVDIVHVDAGMNEKAHWLVWFDTSTVERANPTQYSHVIEGIDYVEGDSFSAEIRHPIPEAERGDYKEFANVGP